MKNVVDLLGRMLLSFIFLYDAYDSIFYFKDTRAKLTAYGLTWKQDWLIVGAIIFIVLGGLMLLFGYRAKLGAVLLLLYWVPMTFIVHAFWEYEEPTRRLQALLFTKNIAIMGALLLVWANGTGKFSIKRILATTHVPGT